MIKSKLLAATLALFGLLLCASCSSSSSGDDATAACTSMCKHLIDDLGNCGKSVDQDGCVSECKQHVSDGESTESDVKCGAQAADCNAWSDCGDLL